MPLYAQDGGRWGEWMQSTNAENLPSSVQSAVPAFSQLLIGQAFRPDRLQVCALANCAQPGFHS